MIHSKLKELQDSTAVVNCFQITTLVDDSQSVVMYWSGLGGCELLSDYYFSRWFTVKIKYDTSLA